MAIPQGTIDGLAWLLVLEADTRYFIASEDIVIPGHAVHWGLESDEIKERVGGENTDSSISAFPIPDTVDNIPRFLSGLSSGVAELSLIPFDADMVADFGKRIVFKKGRISDIELSPFLTNVSINLIGNEEDDYADLVDPSFIVEERTWPLAIEDARGKRYPRVYGAPGSFEYETQTDSDGTLVIDYLVPEWGLIDNISWVTTRTTKTAGATPALAIDQEQLSIKIYTTIDDDPPNPPTTYAVTYTYPGHPRYLLAAVGKVEASIVEVWTKTEAGDGWLTRDCPIVTGYDGRGRVVSLVDMMNGATTREEKAETVPFRKGDEFWISWKHGGATSSSLGSIIQDFLAVSTVQIDQSALNSAARYLQRYKIGGYVDDSITPTAWVDDRLKNFGVVTRWSQEGYSLQVVDPAWQSFASASLVVGKGAEVAGTIKFIPPELDEVIVSWTGPGASETAHRRISSKVTRVGAPQIIGGNRRDNLSLPECWDSSTAIAAGELALRLAAGYTEIQVVVDTLTYWWLRAGDSVYLTWDDLAFSQDDGPWQIYETEHTTSPTRSLVLRRYNTISTVAQATIESSTLDD